MSKPFHIDAVYLWVDGNDPSFQNNLELYRCEVDENFAISANRFSDHQELKYSLRSLHQHCPWMRKIFIIAPDGMQPPWLDTQHPQIEIIHHRDFFPTNAVLPTFQSDTIQSFLHHIEGLAEHFILLDDDFFIGKPLPPNDFFTKDGKALCTFMRFRHNLKKTILRTQWSPFDHSVHNSHQLIKKSLSNRIKDGNPFPQFIINYGLHQVSAFRKSAFAALWENPTIAQKLECQMKKRFRASTNIQPILLSKYMALEKGTGIYHPALDYELVSLGNDQGSRKQLQNIAESTPSLFCINDMLEAPSDNNAGYLRELLEGLYPVPSPYES